MDLIDLPLHLPIADMTVNAVLILAIGGGTGFLSGLTGVGGGFLMTPLLIMIGIPPAIAVASSAAQIVASSVSGVLAHMQRGNVDFKMGTLLLLGGLAGSTFGVWLFGVLRALGQMELVVSLSYVLILGGIGVLMLTEVVGTWRKARAGGARPQRRRHTWLHSLPGKMRFPRSRIYVSAIAPVAIGVLVGVMTAVMGVGGGFIVVPAMIYLLGMPTSVVVGTSLFQIIFVTANVTFLQAYQHHTVDMLLALLLLIGGVVGAQFGARLGQKLRGEQLRGLLALMVLGVAVELAWQLATPPADAYSIEEPME